MKAAGFECKSSAFGGKNRVEFDDKFWGKFGGEVGVGGGFDMIQRLLHWSEEEAELGFEE